MVRGRAEIQSWRLTSQSQRGDKETSVRLVRVICIILGEFRAIRTPTKIFGE